MHTASGLLDELAGGTTLADAEEQVLAYVREHVAGARQGPAVRQLGRHRPRLPRPGHARRWRSYLHYRIVDVSSIKELARRWYPRAYFNSPEKNGNHRALADIRESIAELRYYREAVFVPQPGPDSDTAQHDRRQARPACGSRTDCRGRTENRGASTPPDPVHFFSAGREARQPPVMVGVAQLVEHLVVVQDVAGSSPVTHPDRQGAGP